MFKIEKIGLGDMKDLAKKMLDYTQSEENKKEEREQRIKNRDPENGEELLEILQKEHEETFKKITLEGQLDKYADECEEYYEATNIYDETKELADRLIAAVGVRRFAKRFAEESLIRPILEEAKNSDDYSMEMFCAMVLAKSEINKHRVWKNKDGKLQHVEK